MRKRTRTPRFSLVFAVIALAFLSACGQKGPLYLPPPPAETTTPEPVPEDDVSAAQQPEQNREANVNE